MALPLLPAASRQRNVSDSGGDAASLPSPLLSPPLSCLAPVPGLPRCRCRLARPFPSGQARPSQAGVDAAATGRSPAALRRPEGWRGRNKMPFGCPLESCSPQKLPAESAPGWRSKCRCHGEACPPPLRTLLYLAGGKQGAVRCTNRLRFYLGSGNTLQLGRDWGIGQLLWGSLRSCCVSL